MIKKINFYLFIFLFFFNTNLLSLDKNQITDTEKFRSQLETLNWQNLSEPKEFFYKIKKADAEIHIIDSEIFLNNFNDINQFSYWAWGTPVDKETVLYIQGQGYNIFVEYKNNGYVKIDDWKQVKSKDLMDEMQRIAKSNVQYLKSQGLSYTTDIKWIYKPTFDEKSKLVFYSYEVSWSDGEKTMENRSIALGRRGHIDNSYVVKINKDTNLLETAEFSKEFGESVLFGDGSKHSDYKSGDRIAAVGLGGLVAGSLGVKALAKAGAFAKFLPLLAKFWWILLAPFLLLFSFVGKKNKSKPKRRK